MYIYNIYYDDNAITYLFVLLQNRIKIKKDWKHQVCDWLSHTSASATDDE